MHPAALPREELQPFCQITRTRASGPGGQHRNKVETAIVITHQPTGIRGQASERRSQSQNLDAAWLRLRIELALGRREPWNSGTSPLWQSRCRGGKLNVSPSHEDFPALLAEALDALANFDWDTAQAAAALQISGSQLVKFLKLEPAALRQVNQAREQRGQHALK